MTNMRRLLLIVLCMVTALSFLPASLPTVNAAEAQIQSELDFSSMPAQDNTADSVRIIKEAGAVDASNLFLAGNHYPIANPGGYTGEGYYIQKLDAGEGNVLTQAQLDLSYWMCDSENKGYFKVLVSTDNRRYVQVFEQTEGNGPHTDPANMQQIVLDLPEVEGSQTAYIQVLMMHWTTWEGSGVKTSIIRANVKEAAPSGPDGTDENVTTIVKKFDFASMPTNVVKDEVKEDLLHYGLVDCNNVQIGGNYGNVATPGGYMGEGYVVYALEAPEGQTLLGAKLDLEYWAYNFDVNVSAGYVRVLVSTDGENYTQISDFKGSLLNRVYQIFSTDLPMAEGVGKIYIKVLMQHWESYEGAAVKKITLTGYVPRQEDVEPGPTDPQPTNPDPTDPSTNSPTHPETPTTQGNPTAPTTPPSGDSNNGGGNPIGWIVVAVCAVACGFLLANKFFKKK